MLKDNEFKNKEIIIKIIREMQERPNTCNQAVYISNLADLLNEKDKEIKALKTFSDHKNNSSNGLKAKLKEKIDHIKKLSKEHESGKELLGYWEKTSKKHKEAADYYRTELEKAHSLVGRIVQQFSERWDKLNLTSHFPTGNLHGNRSYDNPTGEK